MGLTPNLYISNFPEIDHNKKRSQGRKPWDRDYPPVSLNIIY